MKENRGNKTYQSRLTRWVDRLLPFHFTVEHVPGFAENMGFADYLSCNPTGKAPDPNTEDNNFVINEIINEITFNLIKNDLTPNGANKHYADIKRVNPNDVRAQNQTHSEQNNAFSLNTHSIQLHLFHPHLVIPSKSNSQKASNPSDKLHNSELVAITTQKNPGKETYSIPIQKRFRAPNKKQLLQMETDNNQPKNISKL